MQCDDKYWPKVKLSRLFGNGFAYTNEI